MAEYEVRGSDNLAVRVEAEDEPEALEKARQLGGPIEATAVLATEPVGAAGGDPE